MSQTQAPPPPESERRQPQASDEASPSFAQAELEALAWAPAIGLDFGPQLAAALLLCRRELTPKTALRAAELAHAVDPEHALDLVKPLLEDATGIGAEASRIMARIALAAGRLEEAKHRAQNAADCLPHSPAVKLLEARLAAVDSRPAAIHAISQVMASDTFAQDWPELAAEALWSRARWLAEEGELSAAQLDLCALEALAESHGAVFTALLTQMGRRLLERFVALGIQGNPAAALSAQLQTLLVESAPPSTPGPMPAWLHALAFHTAGQHDGSFGKAVLFMCQLLEATQALDATFQGYLWGQQLCERLDGAEPALQLRAAFERFRQRMGSERFTELSERESLRIGAFDGPAAG